jgi:mannosyltransferase OCH1-like enzyme
MLPKIIHQIWFQGVLYITQISKERIDKIKSIHNIPNQDVYKGEYKGEYNEDSNKWTYRLWDETQILELLQTLDKKYIDKYYKFTYLHQKVDYAKFIILKKYGGIYIDIDCNVIKNLDGLYLHSKDNDFIISYISQTNKLINYFGCGYANKCINNGIIISKKNTDICDYIIDELKYDCNNLLNKKSSCIQNTTGPKIFNKIIYSYINSNKQNKSKILILPYEFVEPCLFNICKNTENTYIEHIHEWSWVNNFYKNICMNYTKNSNLINLICIMIVIYLIYHLYLE